MRPIPFVLSIVLIIGYKLLRNILEDPYLALLIFLPVVILLIVNFAIRKKLKSKDWFLKSLSFLNEQVESEFTSDLTPSLLFDKIKEEVEASTFKLYDYNIENKELLAGNAIGIRTWGENLYIEISPINDNESKVKLSSVTVFGLFSWNKNAENIQKFHNDFEESLTI